jgi:hypothetical protein
MKIFASVIQEFLILPVGLIFGARNSPSFFTLLSETRAHIASNFAFQDNDKLENMTPLTQRVHLVPPPTPRESTTLVQAVAGS